VCIRCVARCTFQLDGPGGDDTTTVKSISAVLSEPARDQWMHSPETESPGILEPPAGVASTQAALPVINLPEPAVWVRNESFPVRFGDYELLEELGRGGMGIVYKARQVGLDRMVAVKLMQPGEAATPELLQRFDREAKSAATLQHPGIVPIYEVGQIKGRPFFSMEFIPGHNLDRLTRERPLTPRAAAEHLKALGEAMAYAHEQGILHRDLKPSNILMDAHGHPRITDFGLAKRFRDASELTLTRQILGTPQYIPPEQIGGTAEPRSDIYALGAVLYYLLTGRPPFQAATLEEILLQVIDRDPVSPRSLNPAVPRDLETICLKCLEKDPGRRYGTATELVEDCGRWLRHEPIRAQPQNLWSRGWKWAKRKPAVATLAAALLMTAMTAFVVTLWQLSATEQARKDALRHLGRATREGAKKEHFARFLTEMLAGVGPSVALGRDTELLREILDETNQRLTRELAGEPELEAELRSTLGKVYLELSEAKLAEAAFRRVLELERMGGWARAGQTAQALTHLGTALQQQGRASEAESFMLEGLALRRQLGDADGLAHALNNLSILRADIGQLDSAEVLQREALALRKQRGNDPSAIANSLANLAGVIQKRRRFEEAEALQREALLQLRRLPTEGGFNVFIALNNLASLLRSQGKLTEAKELLEQARDCGIRLAGPEHPRISAVLGNLGAVLEEQGNLSEAENLHRQALSITRKSRGDRHPSVAGALHNVALVLQKRGQIDEAEALHREALAVRRTAFGNEHKFVAESLNNLGDALYLQDKWGEAESLHREALAMRRRFLGTNDPDVVESLNNLARVRHRQGALAEAESLHREALDLRRRACPEGHPDIAISLINLGQVLHSRRQSGEAEKLLKQAVEIRQKHFGAVHRDTANVWNSLGTLFYEQGRWQEAQSAYAEVLRIRTQLFGSEHLEVGRALRNLGLTLLKQNRSTEAATLLRTPMVAAQERVERLISERQFTAAEPIARDSLKMWTEFSGQTWRRFHAESLLGACLFDSGKTEAAGKLLLSGHDGLERLRGSISAENEPRVRRNAIERLLQFYRATKEPKAADLQTKLAELDAASR
jgi:tetratricopeptide (TPR) repeat protein/predicted Ser/Thr protein kinase